MPVTLPFLRPFRYVPMNVSADASIRRFVKFHAFTVDQIFTASRARTNGIAIEDRGRRNRSLAKEKSRFEGISASLSGVAESGSTKWR